MRLKLASILLASCLLTPVAKSQTITPEEQAIAQALLASSPTNGPGYLDWLLIKVLQQVNQPVPASMYNELGAFAALVEQPSGSLPPDPGEGSYGPASDSMPPLPWLFITGLPCPGAQGEPSTNHPLVWQARCANEPSGRAHRWLVWTNRTLIDYGDVVSATWAGECRDHPTTWSFLRTEVVWTNSNSVYLTNTGHVKMRPGFNFDVSYIYWFTNESSLCPTNFDVAQVPVSVSRVPNQTPLLPIPAAYQGETIAPPIYEGFTNAITSPTNWPRWTGMADDYPRWPLSVVNADGFQIIGSVPQAPIIVPQFTASTNAVTNCHLLVHAIPGNYILQTTTNLPGPWVDETNFLSGADGTAHVHFLLAGRTNLFARAKYASAFTSGLGYLAAFQGPSGWSPEVLCSGNPQLSWTFDAGWHFLAVSPSGSLTRLNFGYDGWLGEPTEDSTVSR